MKSLSNLPTKRSSKSTHSSQLINSSSGSGSSIPEHKSQDADEEEVADISIEELKFNPTKIPTMTEFCCKDTFLSSNLVEVCLGLFFDDKGRGRLEPNSLLIFNSFITQRVVERLLYTSRMVFMSALAKKAFYLEDEVLQLQSLDSSSCEKEKELPMLSELDEAFIQKFDNSEILLSGDSNHPTNNPFLKSYAKHSPQTRKALRVAMERKSHAIVSLEPIIELWKQLFQFCMSSASSHIERSMKILATESRDYDPYITRRSLLILLIRYLLPVWTHEHIYSLPSSVSKSLLDLIQLSIKAIQDVRQLPMLSFSKTDAAGAAKKPLSSVYHTTTREAPLGSSSSAAAARRNREPFRADESVISVLVGMGFARSHALSAATALQVNDVSVLTDALLSNNYPIPRPGISTPEPLNIISGAALSISHDSQPSASSDEQAPQVASLATNSSDPLHALPEVNESTIASLLESQLGIQLSSLLTTDMDTDTNGGVDYSKTQVVSNEQVLPMNTRASNPELKKDRDLIPILLTATYLALKPVSMKIIECSGIGSASLWDHVSAAMSFGDNRESMNVAVLTSLWKGLEKHAWPESSLKVIVLSWLFTRGIEILQNSSETNMSLDSSYRLYGILHSIILILSDKVHPSGRPAASSSNEFLLLMFTRDTRYSGLYSLLLMELEKSLTSASNWEINSLVRSEVGLFNVDIPPGDNSYISSRLSWIVPALLLLDIVGQSILVDSNNVENTLSALTDIESTSSKFISELMDAGFFDHLITPELMAVLNDEIQTPTKSSLLSFEGNGKDTLRSNIQQVQSIQQLLNRRPDLRTQVRQILDAPDISQAEKRANMRDLIQKVESETKASSERYETRKRKLLDDRDAAANHSVGKSTDESSSENDEILILPLNCKGLSAEQKLWCVEVGVGFLKKLILLQEIVDNQTSESAKSSSDKNISTQRIVCIKNFRSLLAQAAMQLLVHVTRETEPRIKFQSLVGSSLLLHLGSFFEGISSLLFTLLQHQIEEPQYLQNAMEMTIRLCWMRLSAQKSVAVKLKPLLEVLTPLVYRNQYIFMKALNSACEFKNLDGDPEVTLKELNANAALSMTPAFKRVNSKGDERSQAKTAEKQNEQPEFASNISPNPSAVKKQSNLRTPSLSRISSSKSPARSSSIQKTIRKGTPLHTSQGGSQMHAIMDNLLSLVVQKWVCVKDRYTLDSSISSVDKPSESFVFSSSLPISDLLITVADLISSVPSLASCVHRFYVSKCSVPVGHTQSSFSTSLRNYLRHSVTHEPMWPCTFVTFLIHGLMLSDITSLTSMKDATKVEELRSIMGSDLRSATTYLFSSLVSRAGEGRRRVLSDLLEVLKIPNVQFATTSKLKAVIFIAETILYLLNPPSQWNNRDTFIIPARDILQVLVALNCHHVLGDTMCLISLDHPYGPKATVKLAVPLEIVIRKGLCQVEVPFDQELDTLISVVDKQVHSLGDSSAVVALPKPLPLSAQLDTAQQDHLIVAVSSSSTSQSQIASILDKSSRTMSLDESRDRGDSGTFHPTLGPGTRGIETDHQHLLLSTLNSQDNDVGSSEDDENDEDEDSEDEHEEVSSCTLLDCPIIDFILCC